MRVRRHLAAGTGTPPPAPSPIPRNVPSAGEATKRSIDLEITDTAEGKCRPINYGRFRFSVPIVHADIVSGKLELLAIIGEGPIQSVDYVWVDEQQVYPSPPAWATVQVRLGGSWTYPAANPSPDQTAVTNISNATIKDWTHPGQAYVSMQLTLATAPIQGGIPRVEVQGCGLLCENLASMDPWWEWTENPMWHLADALKRREYGAGLDRATLDAGNLPPHTGFTLAAERCEELVAYDGFLPIGQQNSNQQLLLSTYDRLQSFKAPSRGFKVEIKIRAVSTSGSEYISFPGFIRTTAGGTNIAPDLVSDPVLPTADADYLMWGIWYDSHGFTPGQTLYLVTLASGIPSTSAKLPGLGENLNDAELDNDQWVNPEQICNTENYTYAGPIYEVNETTAYLKASHFGFAIPTDATVTGIKVRISRWAEVDDEWGDHVRDYRLRLMKGGVVQATDYADIFNMWPAYESVRTYGSLGDLWGTTWTPAEINATGFGAVLSAMVEGPSLYPGNYANVNWIEITIYFNTAGGGQAANMKWHHNSLTNNYADGKAQYYNGSWLDINYDHWFLACRAEHKYRCALSITDRQPIESVAQTILRTCNGRLGWWDGKWRATLDELGVTVGTLSDKPEDNPDFLILAGSLTCGTDEADLPNLAAGTYYDVEDWMRKTVQYHHGTYEQGLEQPKELRAEGAPVPSGGQLYRLLMTWILRARRGWKGACKLDQSGIELSPGDVLILGSRLFTGTRAVMIDDVQDSQDGTFSLSFSAWSVDDFDPVPYMAQSVIPTTTTA